MPTDRHQGRFRGKVPEPSEVLSRADYQEILLARMAGGDLMASQLRAEIRRVDILHDRLRDKPLYPEAAKPQKPE